VGIDTVKLVPFNVHAFCAHGTRSWTLAFGSRGDGLRLWLSFADSPSGHASVLAEISDERQIDAIIERIADLTMRARDVAIELLDLLTTLAMQAPEDGCKAFLLDRLDEWIARTRHARVTQGHVA
jgi:hypothetical protein